MRRILNAIVLLGLLTSSADANWIESWGEGVENTDYVIVQQFGTIEILHGNGLEYKFHAETSQGSGDPGVINSITVDTNATGDFTLLIDHPDAGEAGAAHWKAGNLVYAGGTSTIVGIDLAGNICGDGDGHHDNIICEIIDGDITVAGTLSEIGAGYPEGRKLQADAITGRSRDTCGASAPGTMVV